MIKEKDQPGAEAENYVNILHWKLHKKGFVQLVRN